MEIYEMNGLLKRTLASTEYGDLYTPPEATELIAPYIHGRVWECAAGEGHITVILERHGLEVVETDIAWGVDFFDTEVPADADCIVTNPPYKLKDAFLERCFEIGLPFALLLPLTALGGVKRTGMYSRYGLEVLIPDKRINFIYEGAGKACWFHSAWFCHDVLPEKLMFAELAA